MQNNRIHAPNSGPESYAPPSYPNSSHLSQNQSYHNNQVPVELVVDMPPPNGMQASYYHQRPGFGMHNSGSDNDPKTPGYYTQSQFNKPKMPRHSSVSSRSTVSAGSAREQRQHEMIQNKQRTLYENEHQDNVFVPRQSNADEFINRQHQPQAANPRTDNPQVPSATVLPYSVKFGGSGSEDKVHDLKKPAKLPHEVDTTSSSSSDQTISCDSGLPVEDGYPHLLSSVRSPLLVAKPYTNPSNPNNTVI